MVSLTPRAADALRSVQSAKNASGFGIRVQVVAGGCAGYLYDLSLVESGGDGDERFESEGLTVWVDRRAASVIEGLMIDYAQTSYGEGFVFTNPKARGQCGCGASFEL
jgi:iron-sulfur cluster insertion protein